MGSKAEPGDDKWEPEEPRLLRRTIELLISAGVLSAEGIPRYLGVSPHDVEKICGLRYNYFATPAEVVELATLRATRTQVQAVRQVNVGLTTVVSIANFRK